MRQYFLLFSILLLGLVIISQAQDNDYQPEAETPADNECYVGGTMQSNCDSEWEWQCGWYMARYNNAVFSRAEVPIWCSSLLPREIEAEAIADTGGFPFPTCTATSTSGVTSTYQVVAFADSGTGYHAVASTDPSYTFIDFFMYYNSADWIQNEGSAGGMHIVSTTCALPSFP